MGSVRRPLGLRGLRFGILVPNFGECCGLARNLIELAVEGEDSGWDGFFTFDHILYSEGESVPVVDPWVALAGIATKTERIRIGTLVTPIARRRPWKLARETVSIDHLSGGRLVLGVGLGEPAATEFEPFGENSEDRARATKLDEGLEALVGLWSGEQVNYEGQYYTIRNVRFLPRCLQTPRIPIWVAGRWPRRKPFLRAVRWDGVFPLGLSPGSKLSPNEMRNVSDFIKSHRTDTSRYDIVATSGANGQEASAMLSEYAAAGATWWMQDMRRWRNSCDHLMAQIRKGPPKV